MDLIVRNEQSPERHQARDDGIFEFYLKKTPNERRDLHRDARLKTHELVVLLGPNDVIQVDDPRACMYKMVVLRARAVAEFCERDFSLKPGVLKFLQLCHIMHVKEFDGQPYLAGLLVYRTELVWVRWEAVEGVLPLDHPIWEYFNYKIYMPSDKKIFLHNIAETETADDTHTSKPDNPMLEGQHGTEEPVEYEGHDGHTEAEAEPKPGPEPEEEPGLTHAQPGNTPEPQKNREGEHTESQVNVAPAAHDATQGAKRPRRGPNRCSKCRNLLQYCNKHPCVWKRQHRRR
jgi:hypothetical protein